MAFINKQTNYLILANRNRKALYDGSSINSLRESKGNSRLMSFILETRRYLSPIKSLRHSGESVN